MTRLNPSSANHSLHAASPYCVVGQVHACVQEFELAFVRTADDFEYALTPDTKGIRLSDLQEGETIECLISAGLPRVLSASLVPERL